MASPAQYDFTGDGSTRIFPVASRIISQEYLKIEIDEEQIIDLTTYDVINNSIVFKTPPINNAEITIRVAESIEGISELDNLTVTQIVADNINEVRTVAYNIDDVSIVADIAEDVAGVSYIIDDVQTVAYNIDNVNSVGDNINSVIDVRNNLEYIWNVEDNLAIIEDVSTNMPTVKAVGDNIDELLQGNAIGTLKGATITVGGIGDPGLYDFETLHEALRWAEISTMSNGGSIRIVVHEGTPLLAPMENQSEEGTFYEFRNCEITIVSGDARSITAYLPDGLGDHEDATLFKLSNAVINIDNVYIAFDEYTGNLYPDTIIPIHATNGSVVNFNIVTVSGYSTIILEKSVMNVDQAEFWDYAESMISVRQNSFLKLVEVEFNNNGYDIEIRDNSQVMALLANQVEPITAYALYPDTTFNAIDTDGSFFTDGTTPLASGGGDEANEVISSQTIKLVGHSKTSDFDDLTTAFEWINSVAMEEDGEIILRLHPGTYVMPDFATIDYYYYDDPIPLVSFRNKRITIEADQDYSYYPGDVIITYPDNLTYYGLSYGDFDGAMFDIRGGLLKFRYIFFDVESGYYDYDYYDYLWDYDLFHAHEGATVQFDSCIIYGFHSFFIREGSTATMFNSEVVNPEVGFNVELESGSTMSFSGCDFNAEVAFDARYNSNIYFSGCTSNGVAMSADGYASFAPNINTIEYDGSCISDATTPLISANTQRTTANRPVNPPPGVTVFDTTLGKPIWHNGTNWVDSAGTIV